MLTFKKAFFYHNNVLGLVVLVNGSHKPETNPFSAKVRILERMKYEKTEYRVDKLYTKNNSFIYEVMM